MAGSGKARSLRSRLAKIELLALDVDGVLTDGGIYIGPRGVEMKRFHVQDGAGIKMLMGVGVEVAFVTGRPSPATRSRARELGIIHIHETFHKAKTMKELLATLKLSRDEAAFMGDDVMDIEAFKEVGLSIAPANAVDKVKKAADIVTKLSGGHGAVREIADLIIKAKK